MPEAVYISSTYNDLKDFRQAVINCIVSLGDYYKPLSMEFYDAEDVNFVKKCLDDVTACNIYILILGKRYGYIPKGFNKSITEMEYEKAVECKKNGMQKEILVFKTGDLIRNYEYKEGDPSYVEYQQNFLNDVTEKLSPRPFDSEADLKFQVSNTLMKRLFKLIKSGEKIIPPDKDSVICYCDRNTPITNLKRNILLNQKKIFFVQGSRKTDFPGGIVKRFAKYCMGSVNKIEPLIKITDLFSSNEPESNIVSALWNILEYLNRPATENNTQVKGFLDELALIKSDKIILPFYYDFEFDEDADKLSQFFSLTDYIFSNLEAANSPYQLFFIIIIYSAQPDMNAINASLQKTELLKKRGVFIEKLKQVTDDDITDWLERFITRIEFSSALYEEYFKEGKALYNMQEVNLKLNEIIEDLGNADERIKKYL